MAEVDGISVSCIIVSERNTPMIKVWVKTEQGSDQPTIYGEVEFAWLPRRLASFFLIANRA
jgi:hypothetical protein